LHYCSWYTLGPGRQRDEATVGSNEELTQGRHVLHPEAPEDVYRHESYTPPRPGKSSSSPLPNGTSNRQVEDDSDDDPKLIILSSGLLGTPGGIQKKKTFLNAFMTALTQEQEKRSQE